MARADDLTEVVKNLMEVSNALSSGKHVSLVLCTDVGDGADARTILLGSIPQCAFLLASANASLYDLIVEQRVRHLQGSVDSKAN